jgi:hypothetical protein
MQIMLYYIFPSTQIQVVVVLTEIYSKALYNINTQRDGFIQKENAELRILQNNITNEGE